MRLHTLFARTVVRLASGRGFSTAEATTILSAMSIIGATMAPAASDYLAEAKLIKAAGDTRAIAIALVRETSDTHPQMHKPGAWAAFELLAGDGEVPQPGSGDPMWLLAATDPRVGALAQQLVVNGPGYTTGPLRLGFPTGWHGPYIENSITPDPWGNRYAVNSRALAVGGGLDTIVVSAGSNGLIETPFKGDGLVAGGDDIVALVSAGN